jgi:hypothetical protein
MEGEQEPLKIQASDTVSVGSSAGASATDSARASDTISIGTKPLPSRSANSARPNVTSRHPKNVDVNFPLEDARGTRDPLGTYTVLIKDPLSEVTRRERRTFLGVSILAIAVIKANLIPNKITAFGVDIDHVKHQELVTILTAIVIYFLSVFVAYAYTDFLAWRIAFWDALRAHEIERQKLQNEMDEGAEPDPPELAECYDRQLALSKRAIPTSACRAFLDFLLPIFVGLAALMVLRGWA